tara:strand:+ start:195 stop:548 length:354 start_codon:yes stop_codon:yes gene_type:complete
LHIRLKVGATEYKVSSENYKKIMDFAGMFYDPDIKIQEISRVHIYVRDEDREKMSDKEKKAIIEYCQAGNIKEFQTYEKPEDLSVSMSGEDIQGINSLQSGLKDLIYKFTNKPKIVA